MTALPILLIGLPWTSGSAAMGGPPGDHDDDVVPKPVAAAMSGVVRVTVREVARVPVYRGGRFREEEIEGLGAGSGVVVSKDGLILTNAHVVAGSRAVRVRTATGRDVGARVISIDTASDLALLRSGPEMPTAIPLSEDPVPAAGTRVFLVGNRGDRGMELAWARIGEHRRVRAGARPLEFWTEIEGPVGPGNSGGAVLDSRGRLIGIPSLQILYAETSRPVRRNSGLFVPVEHVRRALQKMLEGPQPEWPWLGLVLDDPLIAASEGRGWDHGHGAGVRTVVAGGPSAGAGFRRGDRVLTIANPPIRDNFEALETVLTLSPDVPVRIVVQRGDSRMRLEVTPGVRPTDPRPDALDDFALHTGLRLVPDAGDDRRITLAFAAMSPLARNHMPEFEADLFARAPLLASILPGQDALAGRSRRLPIRSLADFTSLLQRCFVGEQFVALAHWSHAGISSIDRAHVHRKIYPFIL